MQIVGSLAAATIDVIGVEVQVYGKVQAAQIPTVTGSTCPPQQLECGTPPSPTDRCRYSMQLWADTLNVGLGGGESPSSPPPQCEELVCEAASRLSAVAWHHWQ